MSSARTTKRNQLKGQTVLGDYFPKPNKSNKSQSSTVKKKFDEKSPRPGTEAKSKAEKRKEEISATVVSKKTEKTVKKGTDLPIEEKAGEGKRSSLKRKVTGAGMFTFSWTRGAQRDTEQYRNGYPDKDDDPDLNDNHKFYTNQISSKPDGDYIDKIHVDWWGDYRRLEVHHGYIQWLFPIRESGLNWHAQELQLHEIKKIQKNKKAMKRILTSYKMMLNFYGMKLDNEEDGMIVREENWRHRFAHLNRSYHNYLRITRILKCLGEFGYEHLKKNFVKFVLYEGLEEGTLSNVIESCVKYWIGVLKDDDEREEMFDYYEKLMQDDSLQSKRRNRSPSPPSYSNYWSNKEEDSKVNKKHVSKKGRDKKDEVDGDVETDDETLSYAMSLIDEDLTEEKNSKNRKTRKDHEMSDSDYDNDDNIEESQEMSHWSREKEANAEEIEGGSECDDSVPGRVAKTSVNEAPTKEESQDDVEEQNIDNNTESNGDSTVVNEESESRKEKDFVCSEDENKDEDSAVANVKENGEKTNALDENCNGNNGLKSEKDIDPHVTDHEEMDTTETINVASSEAVHVSKDNVEEKSIESKENEDKKPSDEVGIKEEENMET